MRQPLLAVENLRTHFHTRDGVVRAVDGVSFDVAAGETLAIVGESGCGKSVTSMSILRLLPMPPARFASGRVVFEGRDLLGLPETEMRKIRGNAIAMIFQEPMTSLNPVLTIGRQITEALVLHRGLSEADATTRAIEMLRKVHMPEAEQRVAQYPHQLSGGMRQRVMLAIALVLGPKVLIADEPTTALDVTIQAQILELIAELRDEMGMCVLLITHNLAVVHEIADHVAVMYAGEVVESAPRATIFDHPQHPYTQGLLRSMPGLTPRHQHLPVIPGRVPELSELPAGCRFAPRCANRIDRCASHPSLDRVETNHELRCYNPTPF